MYFRLNSQSAKFHEIIKKDIPKPVKTRWNYELRMIQAISDIGKEIIRKAIYACKSKVEERNQYLLSTKEFLHLSCLVDLLEPVATISEKAQGKETTIEIVSTTSVIISICK